jgi:hypothetical protein
MDEKVKPVSEAVVADAMVAKKPAAAASATPAKQDNSTRNILLVLGGCLAVVVCLVVCVFVIIPAVTLGGIASIGNKVADDIEKSQQVNTDAYNRPSKINDTVKVGNIEWQVTKSQDFGSILPSYSEYLDDVTNNEVRFIRVEFSAKNMSSNDATILSLNVVDDKGRTFSLSGNTYLTLKTGEQSSVFASLDPDIRKSFVDIYEVPTDAKGLRLEVTDLNLLTPQKAYIDLGL